LLTSLGPGSEWRTGARCALTLSFDPGVCARIHLAAARRSQRRRERPGAGHSARPGPGSGAIGPGPADLVAPRAAPDRRSY